MGVSDDILLEGDPIANLILTPSKYFVEPGEIFNVDITAIDPWGNVVPNGTADQEYDFICDSLGFEISLTGSTSFSANRFTPGILSIALRPLGSSLYNPTGEVDVEVDSLDPTTQFALVANTPAQIGYPTSFTVTAEDAGGNRTGHYAGKVHLVSSDTGATLTTYVKLTQGTGTFSATFKNPGAQTISASDTANGAIAGTSNSIDVSYAPAATLVVTAPSTAVTATAFQVNCRALDANGNPTAGYTGPVHFTSTDPLAVLPADSTLINGARSFSVKLKTPGAQTVTVTDIGNSSLTGTTGMIGVVAGAYKFVVSAPATATAGTGFQFTITAEDALGNVATGYSGTFQLTTTDPLTVLPGNFTLLNGTRSGVVRFSSAGN